MKGSAYTIPTAEGEDDTFRESSTGGPILSFLTILLFACTATCDVEISLETYNGKIYGAKLPLNISEIDEVQDLVARECYDSLLQAAMYSPIFCIPRFFDNMRDILVPSRTVLRHGELVKNIFVLNGRVLI